MRRKPHSGNAGSSQGDRNEVGGPPSELRPLEYLITLHDIGKINTSEEILIRPGSLDEREWEIKKRDPGIGHLIAQPLTEFAHVAVDILAHHER